MPPPNGEGINRLSTDEIIEPECYVELSPSNATSALETATRPEVIIDLSRESVAAAQPGDHYLLKTFSELEEEYSGRDDEPIVGQAAVEFEAEAAAHPERYAYLAEWFIREASHAGRRRPESIIDAGCGPGILTQMVAKGLSDTSFVGVDISPDMVSLARRSNGTDRVKFVQGDARESLEIAQRPVDAVLSRRMIHRVEGLDDVLGQMAEAVKPGGGMVLNYSFRRPTDEPGQLAFIAACEERAAYKDLHSTYIRAVLNAPTLEQYIEACQRVGRRFDLRHCHIKVFPFDIGIVMIR